MRTFSLPCPAPFWQMSSIEIDKSKGLCEVEFGEVEDENCWILWRVFEMGQDRQG